MTGDELIDDKRTYEYNGFEMTSGIGGDPTNGFYVVTQWISVTDRRNDAGDDRRNGASWKWSKTRIRTDSRMRFFSRFRKTRVVGFGHRPGCAEAVAVEHDAVGAVT
ncbi:hypothetical protein B0G77_6782 [Paraburkholderia sp. BL10I2N1]|nr:hypothetical protein B0G77_6782 [Paraburkholderia sp. BL10I2N1]